MNTVIFEKVKSNVVEQLQIRDIEITPETHFIEDINADSLDLLGLAFALEEEFGVEFEDEDLPKFSTVGDVVEHIERNVRGEATASPDKFVLVRGDGWCGLYKNGQLLEEDHRLDAKKILKLMGIDLEERWADLDWLNNLGRLPDELGQVKFESEEIG